MTDLDSKNFEDIIGNFTEAGGGFKGHSRPLVLYLYTPTCVNCKTISPILEKLENQLPAYRFVKADATNLVDFCEAANIMTVPTILLISTQGDPIMLSGIPTESNLRKVLDDFVK